MKLLYFLVSVLFITSCGGGGLSDESSDASVGPIPAPNPVSEPQCSESTAGKIIDCTVTYDNLDRQFSYYLPSNYSAESEDLPLLLSLHGGDDTSESNISYTWIC